MFFYNRSTFDQTEQIYLSSPINKYFLQKDTYTHIDPSMDTKLRKAFIFYSKTSNPKAKLRIYQMYSSGLCDDYIDRQYAFDCLNSIIASPCSFLEKAINFSSLSFLMALSHFLLLIS